ncbi:MAG: Ketose-bisphosphate aldolase, class-II [Parcubacteria group bacterium GW2011_GWF2_38_8]|nr:MAG: Ketose-bisphosphate aldolase, class-II [Parcubacteria group bacterium GW2011_GWF2_38_8]
MRTLREYIKEAEEKKIAIGHFNISNLETWHGVYNAARKLGVPVIIGLSEGEEDFVGKNEAIGIIKEIRKKENYPVFLNADHHYSFERVKISIDAGFDAVIFDGAKLGFEENARTTKKCVDYARSVNKDVLVEAELGYIGSGSDIKDAVPKGAGMKTDPKEAKKFVEITGVDMFAPSVGNIHGLIKSGNPHVDAKLIREIKEATEIPLVLHGGSGISDEDFINAIKAGISIIHISTEIRIAYEEALKKSLIDNPSEIAPYKILQPAVEAVEKIAEARLKLFNNLN